jgi:plasmid maintenance system antidote protein VapI
MKKDLINGRFLEAIQSILQRNEGLSKTFLAESLDVKPAKFSEILNGRMKAGVDMMATVCEKYDISTEWLLLDKGAMIRQSEGAAATVRECSSDCSSGVQKEGKSCSNGVQTPSDSIMMQLLDKITGQAEEIGRLKQALSEANDRADEAERRANQT